MHPQSSRDCRSAYKNNEALEDQGIASVWFDLINRHKHNGADEANAEDVNAIRHWLAFSDILANLHDAPNC